MALADDTSPVFVARAHERVGSLFLDMAKIADAFRGDGALSWGDHHPCLFSGTEWFFRTGYRAELPSWIPALDGVADELAAGGNVADVGCGHGASAVVLAAGLSGGNDPRFRLPCAVDRDRARTGRRGRGRATDQLRVADAKELPRQLRPDLLLRLPARHG